jgi:hypothetical protein
MRIERVIALAVALLAGGSLITSCGNDTEELTKPEFVAQANAICEAADVELEPIFDSTFAGLEELDWDDEANDDLIFGTFAEAAVQARPIWDQMTDDLRDLHEPDADHDVVEELLDDLQSTVAEFTEQITAAAEGDESAKALIDDENEDPFDDVNQRAREYGLASCEQPD